VNELQGTSRLVKVNLIFRFFLELAMFAGFAAAPALALSGGSKWILAAVAPLAAMAVWGVFATQGDPSRSGRTVIPTPGPARLLLELGLFAGSAGLMLWAGSWQFAAALAAGVIVHYLAWPARIRWLLKH